MFTIELCLFVDTNVYSACDSKTYIVIICVNRT